MSRDSYRASVTLAEALALANAPAALNESRKVIQLACGFTPLHLSTFLKAHGRIRFPSTRFDIESGLFDDLAGSILRIQSPTEAVVVVEWADLDPRLGLRHSGGWSHLLFPDIEEEVTNRLNRMRVAIRQVAQESIVVLVGPTLPLPPIGFTGPGQDSSFELKLQALVASALADLSSLPNLRVISGQELAVRSPLDSRLDPALALSAGFPYTLSHANALARIVVEVFFPVEPRKGLITDLDDTLWRGILGEVGVDNIAWSLETRAQQHGLFQQYLAALANRGVLMAIASKNDGSLVERAFERDDILCARSSFFPVECNWGAKSASVSHILKTWNIGPEDAVFVDDSPAELAEVAEAFPGITCILFPRNDSAGLLKMLQQLRCLFGRRVVLDEDRIRLASIRSVHQAKEDGLSLASDDFLRQLQGEVVLDFTKDSQNSRAFELVNKTNQFNLNGRRWTEAEWLELLRSPERFLLTVSYSDKFGSLGRIAVIAGRMVSSTLQIETWVMSCRALSRRIEYEVLARMIALWSPERVELDFQPTERNGPLRMFLQSIAGSELRVAPVVLTSAEFEKHCPLLCHDVSEACARESRSASCGSL
jgi:FkbH-like protein